MMSLCSSFTRVSVSSKKLTFRANGIAAAPKLAVHQAACISRPAPKLVAVPIEAKLKTRKAAAKRLKVTSSGKVMIRRAGKQHLNEKMNRATKNKLSKEKAVFAGDVRVNVRGMLPYKKISLRQCRIANKDHV